MATSEEVMAALGDERGPMDYPEWSDERKLLIGIIRRQVENGGGYHESGDKTLLKWILGVLSILTASAIVGGVTLYGKVTSLEATVNAGNARLDRLERFNERR